MNKTQEKVTEKELRSFGLMMGSILAFFITVFFFKAFFKVAIMLSIISVGFFAMGLITPNSLEGIHRRWMKFAKILGSFNMKVILGFAYLTGFSIIRFLFFIIR